MSKLKVIDVSFQDLIGLDGNSNHFNEFGSNHFNEFGLDKVDDVLNLIKKNIDGWDGKSYYNDDGFFKTARELEEDKNKCDFNLDRISGFINESVSDSEKSFWLKILDETKSGDLDIEHLLERLKIVADFDSKYEAKTDVIFELAVFREIRSVKKNTIDDKVVAKILKYSTDGDFSVSKDDWLKISKAVNDFAFKEFDILYEGVIESDNCFLSLISGLNVDSGLFNIESCLINAVRLEYIDSSIEHCSFDEIVRLAFYCINERIESLGYFVSFKR